MALWKGRPLIAHVVERAQQIRGVDQVVVAVPGPVDAEAIGAVLPRAVPVVWYPGIGEMDLVGRYVAAAQAFQAETIVRLTGDTPCLDVYQAARVLAHFQLRSVDYAANVGSDGAEGDTEVMTLSALVEADRQITEPQDREHPGQWLKHCYPSLMVPVWPPRPKHSIDSPEDLAALA